jgi:cell division protein FtsB
MLFAARSFVPTAALGALCLYFGVQAVTGDRGLLEWDQREALLEQRQIELKRINAERADLEARAMLLQDDHLSADLLEERARVMLGFADPRDYVIRVKQG